MKLKSVLKSLSRESILKILQFWEIPLPSGAEIEPGAGGAEIPVEFVYPRLQQKAHFQTAFDKLSEDEHSLIHFLAMHGGDLEKKEVIERMYGGSEEALDELANALARKGFVFIERPEDDPAAPLIIGIPEPYLRFIELPAYWEGYLGFFLRGLQNEQLKHLATHGLKLPVQSIRKDELLNTIRNYLLSPRSLRYHIDQLPEDQRMLFNQVVESKGIRLYSDLLEVGFQKHSEHSRADHVNSLLQSSGLLFTAIPGATKSSSLLMVPRDIYYIVTHHFSPDRRSLRDLDTVSMDEKERGVSGIILDNSGTFLRDIVIFAAQAARLNMRPLANGGIGKNDLKKILPKLSAHKTIKYCQFIAAFLLHRKFLVSTGETFHVSSPFLQWLEDSRLAYEQVLRWWIDASDWNEEFIEGDVIHADFPPAGLGGIQEYRKIVIKNVGELPPDRWCNFDGFAEALDPQINSQIPRRGAAVSSDKNGRINELITESILAETMCWLGLTALSLRSAHDYELIGTRVGDGRTGPPSGRRGRPRKQKATPFVFKLTDLGRAILPKILANEQVLVALPERDDAAYVSPLRCNRRELIVQPSCEILAPPDLNLKAFYNLNEFTDVRSVDVMTTLHISRESIRSGMDHGLHAEDILVFLKEFTQGRAPVQVLNLVKETSEKHGEVNMGYAGGYIVIDDPILLAEIKANKKIVRSIKEVIDNRVVMLNRDVVIRKLAKELQKVGFMPRLASEHVHIVTEDSYHLSLSREDMYNLFAALGFIQAIEESLGQNLTEDKINSLIERLKPDPKAYYALSTIADRLAKTWIKNYEETSLARIEEVKNQYKSQLSKLVSATQPRRSTKYSFDGKNPATEKNDVIRMMQFAAEHEFDTEIQYVKADGTEVVEIIQPESIEREKIYAHCKSRNAYAVYRVDRVLRSRLL